MLNTTQWSTKVVAHLIFSTYLHYSIGASTIKQVKTRFLLLAHFCTLLIVHLMPCVVVRTHRHRSLPSLGWRSARRQRAPRRYGRAWVAGHEQLEARRGRIAA